MTISRDRQDAKSHVIRISTQTEVSFISTPFMIKLYISQSDRISARPIPDTDFIDPMCHFASAPESMSSEQHPPRYTQALNSQSRIHSPRLSTEKNNPSAVPSSSRSPPCLRRTQAHPSDSNPRLCTWPHRMAYCWSKRGGCT